MPQKPSHNRIKTVHLFVEKNRVPAFYPLLSRGIIVKTRVGCSVKTLICNYLGLSADYLEKRLQTIFLDGKAVDDTETTVVQEGATLALSAAMPGLAGATLRRGSAYAAMRNQITHQNGTCGESTKDGTICLKLFNLVAADIGQSFLEKGVLISGRYLRDFFRSASDKIISGIRSGEVDGVRMNTNQIANMDWEQTQVDLKLEAV